MTPSPFVARRGTRAAAALVLSLVLVPAFALAAPPVAPDRIAYQGLLLDSLGQPRTGAVDLTLRLYDAITGGALVYVQTFAGVPLADGVFSVAFGPTGAAADGPTTPLTTSLAAAFTADLGAGPNRFLEVTVGTEGALARTQILSAPFALGAGTAATAGNADAVGGLTSDYVTALFQYGNADGTGAVDADPAEGLGDTDGDGIPNFVDSDNDNDTITDGQEVGSNPNLVTPIVQAANPDTGRSGVTQTVTVSGLNFEPGISVAFGAETPVPSNLTATSFDVSVGAQLPGDVDVTVTRLNGETATRADAFSFLPFATHIRAAVAPGMTFHFDVRGTQQTVVSGIDEYAVDTDADGTPDTEFAFPGEGGITVAFAPSGTLVGVRCRQVPLSTCRVELYRDSDADFDLADETGVLIDALPAGSGGQNVINAPSLAFGPGGETVVGYIRALFLVGAAPAVAHDRNGDGLFTGTNEWVIPEAFIGLVNESEVAVDALGRAAIAFYRDGTSAVVVAFDRSGDGDYNDSPGGNPEIAVVEAFAPGLACLGAAFAPDGDLVVVHTAAGALKLTRDLDGNGSFAGPGEQIDLEATPGDDCDVDSSLGTGLAVAHTDDDDTVHLLVDRNADGDFADATESMNLGPTDLATHRVSAAHNDAGRAFAATAVGTSGGTIYIDPF